MNSHPSICAASAACLPCTLHPSPLSVARSATTPGDDEYSLIMSNSAPPSLNQLATLKALPAGLASLMAAGSKSMSRRKGKRHNPSILKDGQIVSKLYNEMASRPYPSLGLSLEQGITVSLTQVSSLLFTSSTTINVGAGLSVEMNMLSGYGPYLALFDQYKIEQLEAWIDPLVAQGTTVFNAYTSAVDLDDANVPTTFSSVDDKQGSLTTVGGCGHYHRWAPHIAIASYSGTFTSYANAPASWIDSASPAVQHYGLKTVSAPNPAGAIPYWVTIRATCSFRSPGIA